MWCFTGQQKNTLGNFTLVFKTNSTPTHSPYDLDGITLRYILCRMNLLFSIISAFFVVNMSHWRCAALTIIDAVNGVLFIRSGKAIENNVSHSNALFAVGPSCVFAWHSNRTESLRVRIHSLWRFFEYINSTVDSQHKSDLVVNRQIGVGPRDPASMMEYVSVHLRR